MEWQNLEEKVSINRELHPKIMSVGKELLGFEVSKQGQVWQVAFNFLCKHHLFAVLSIVVSYVLEMPRWALLSCTSSKIMWV